MCRHAQNDLEHSQAGGSSSLAPALFTQFGNLPRETGERALDPVPVCVVLLLNNAPAFSFRGIPTGRVRGEESGRIGCDRRAQAWSRAASSSCCLPTVGNVAGLAFSAESRASISPRTVNARADERHDTPPTRKRPFEESNRRKSASPDDALRNGTLDAKDFFYVRASAVKPVSGWHTGLVNFV